MSSMVNALKDILKAIQREKRHICQFSFPALCVDNTIKLQCLITQQS